MGYIGAVGPAYDPTRATVPQFDAERFSGNNSAVAFTLLRQVVSPTDVDVFVENVRQEPIVAYSIVNGSTLTFTEAPQTGTNNIYVIYRGSGMSNYAFVPDGSISYAKLANNIRQFNVDNFTANGTGQTFTLSETPATANTVIAAIDGVVQTAPSNYNISGSTIIFTSAPAASANVTVRHLGFRTTSTVTALSAGSVTATEIVDGAVTNAKLAGSITSDKISSVNGASLLANTIAVNTVSGNVIVANTVSNSAFATGTIENYMRSQTLDFGMRNRIINGAMRIDQRNNGAANTPVNNGYTLDRWKFGLTQASKFTAQQDSSANTVAGFTSSMKVTSSSAYSVTTGDTFFFDQIIEGNNVADLRWGTASARPVTLSFWVRSSLTGQFGGALRNSAADRAYPFLYTIVAANTWEQKFITVAGDTSGTWLTTNGTGIEIVWNLGSVSSYLATAGDWTAGNIIGATGDTSVVGTNGATWYITGIQLEEGSVPTPFEYRQYGTELHLCQRYYKRISRVDSSGGDNGFINLADWDSVNAYGATIISPSMRIAPSLSYSALSDFAYYEGSSIKTPTGITIVGSGPNHAEISIGWSGGLTTGRAGWMRINGASGWLAFSSEI
jgi:uncharacterized protein (DUF697 family)